MRNAFKKFVYAGVVSALAVIGTTVTVQTSAQDRESAGGSGSIRMMDENGRQVRRQFSFQARRGADGTVTGHANLRNGAFVGDNGKKFAAQFDISCLKVQGNRAIVSGFVRRINDANLRDAAVFIVEDNGEPGRDDRITSVFFFDGDPNTTGSPQLCENTEFNAFPLMPIDSGNIQVRSSTTP